MWLSTLRARGVPPGSSTSWAGNTWWPRVESDPPGGAMTRHLVKKSVLFSLGIAAIGCADAESPEATPLLSESALMSHIETLADDSMLGRGAGTTHELLAAQYVRDVFISSGLQPGVDDYLQVFSIGNQGQSPDAGEWSQNVMAILPGRGSLAGQWIVVGAHYDHVGWRRVSADSILIFNGADDNASGTSLMLEVARYLHHHFTEGAGQTGERRSIMFHAYGSEEIGLVGSRHFCQVPTVPLDSVAAMVNLDMVGRLAQNGLTLIGSTTAAYWPDLVSAANTEGLPSNFDDKYMGGSDQWCYYEAGRPVLFFFTGIHSEYHTPADDTWLIDAEGMVDIGELATRVLIEAATRLSLQ